jgi:uncharacterized membrane protein
MLYATLKLLHVGAIVVWVGGMAFAHFFLRPAVAALEPPQRLALMHDVLGRFFAAVLVAVVLAVATGLWMIGDVHQRVAASGGQLVMPWTWTAMTALGLLMTAIFGHIRFALFKRLRRALASGQLPAAAAALTQIRQWVVVNLVLGTVVIGLAVAGGA